MDVQLPDGTLIKGVPDGTSKADLVTKLKGNGMNVPAEWLTDTTKSPSLMDNVKQGTGNLVAGAMRGAGSIGSTILAPIDIAKDALAGKGLSLESNRERRQSMDNALQSMGAEPDSGLYKTGKLGTEVLGTLGAGGAAGNALARIPGLATAAPSFINSVRTSGMTTGSPVASGAVNAIRDLAIRSAGGAVSGGMMAGIVNPEDAPTGAVIGGAAPVVLKGLGALGEAAGRVIRGPAQSQEAMGAVKAAREAGYVIPPTQAKPTLVNRVLEGVSGKITTAQNASAKNAEVTNSLAAKALGLAPDAKITPEVLQDVRNTAGRAYEALGNAGTITPGKAYADALDKIAAPHVQAAAGFPGAKVSPVVDMVDSLRSPSFDSASAIAKIKELRSAADDAFRTGNTDVGRAAKAGAKALEDAVEQHLSKLGGPPSVMANIQQKGTYLSAANEAGSVGGHIRGDALYISHAEISEATRGKGNGVALYQSLVDAAHAKGLRVFSDKAVEGAAVNVYDALNRRGYEVKRLGGALEDGTAFGRNNGPAFEVLGRKGDDLLQNFKDARQLIAKTYSVEKALNPTTGTVDAKKLGALITRGKPLTDELRQAGEFANRFPKAAQTVEKMGSLPQTSPLDWVASGSLGAATGNPAALAGVMIRPGARALALSDLVQNRMATQAGPNALTRLATSPQAQQLIYRAAPVAAGR